MDSAPFAPWTTSEGREGLAVWLRSSGVGRTGQVTLTPLAGGSSGSVLKLEQAGKAMVLRTTSWPPRPDSRKALEREARLLEALGSTKVPHPRFVAWCDDDGVIGAPFLLIEFIDGWLGVSPPLAFTKSRTRQHEAAFAMINAIAELPKVDVASIGLSDFGKPDGFLARQVGRWTALMEKHRAHPGYGSRVVPYWEELAAWLAANRPETQQLSLIHGDVSFSNVMFEHTPPPRVAAIIDWELATLGDPLLDLGRVLYPFPAADGTPGASLAIDLAGYPDRDALAARYASATGLSVANIDYYMVLAMFKLAALIEFNHVKSKGEPAGTLSHRIAAFVPDLVAKAHGITTRR